MGIAHLIAVEKVQVNSVVTGPEEAGGKGAVLQGKCCFPLLWSVAKTWFQTLQSRSTWGDPKTPLLSIFIYGVSPLLPAPCSPASS